MGDDDLSALQSATVLRPGTIFLSAELTSVGLNQFSALQSTGTFHVPPQSAAALYRLLTANVLKCKSVIAIHWIHHEVMCKQTEQMLLVSHPYRPFSKIPAIHHGSMKVRRTGGDNVLV